MEGDDEGTMRPQKLKSKQLKDDEVHDEDDDDDDQATVRAKKKPAKKQVVEEDDEDDGATIRKKKPAKANIKEEEKVGLTLSGAMNRKKDPSNEELHIIEGKRIITQDIIEQFKNLSKEKLESLATMNQVMSICEKKTEIDFKNTDSIKHYMEEKGFNFNEIYSLSFLAQGGESYVLRGDLKQPVEVVIKTVIPDNANQETFISILTESHMIKLLEDKKHVVSIHEEIIEVEEKTNNVLNYLVVVEQAIQDLKNIIKIWCSYERSHKELEFFSNHKLFYFLLKAAQTMQYLHDQNVYYGDMKEQNLLVFRDYQVKLGDFGVSIKMDENTDAEEQIYELKGATQGYTMDKYYNSLRDGDGSVLSKNELIQNDYYTLVQTFMEVKKICENEFSYVALENRQKQHRLRFYSQTFEDDSYFCRFLEELKTANPKSFTLKDLIIKYENQVAQDQNFLIEFCEQLITDEKFLAIPIILGNLWQHRFIPQTIFRFFTLEESKEFKFLKPKQKTEISSDKQQKSKALSMNIMGSKLNSILSEQQKDISREATIESVKNYIKEKVKNWQSSEFVEFIPILCKYTGSLIKDFYQAFYKETFSEFFVIRKGQSTFALSTLRKGKEDGESLLSQILKDFELPASLPQTESALDFHNIQKWGLNIIADYMIFMSYNSSPSEYFDNQLKLNKLLIEFFNQLINGLDLIQEQLLWYQRPHPTLLKLWKQLYTLQLIHTRKTAFNGKLEEEFFPNAKYFNSKFYMFTSEIELIKELYKITKESTIQAKRDRFNWIMPQMQWNAPENDFHKASSFSSVQKYLIFIQEDFISDPGHLRTNFLQSRVLLKRTYGELGNEMSKNAYDIFQFTDKLRKQNLCQDEWVQDGITLLVKACNYSTKSQRFAYTLDLLLQFKRLNLKAEIRKAIKSTNELSHLYHGILLSYFLDESVDDKNKLFQEILLPEIQRQFRALTNSNPIFTEMVLKFIGNEKLKFGNLNLLIKEILLREVVPNWVGVFKDLEAEQEQKQMHGNTLVFEQSRDSQKFSIIFANESKLQVHMVNMKIHGKVVYSLTNGFYFEDKFVDGEFNGPFNYKDDSLNLTGKRVGDDLHETKIIYDDEHIDVPLVNFCPKGYGIRMFEGVDFKVGYFDGKQLSGRVYQQENGIIRKEMDVIRNRVCSAQVEVTANSFSYAHHLLGVRIPIQYMISWEKPDIFKVIFEGKGEEKSNTVYDYFMNGQRTVEKLDNGSVKLFFKSGNLKESIIKEKDTINTTIYYENGSIAQRERNSKFEGVFNQFVMIYSPEGDLICNQYKDKSKTKGVQAAINNGRVESQQFLKTEFRKFYEDNTVQKISYQTQQKIIKIKFAKNGTLQSITEEDRTQTEKPLYRFFNLKSEKIMEVNEKFYFGQANVLYYPNGHIFILDKNRFVREYYYDNGQLILSKDRNDPKQTSHIYDRDGSIIAEQDPNNSVTANINGRFIVQIMCRKWERALNKQGVIVREWDKDEDATYHKSSDGKYMMRQNSEEEDLHAVQFFKDMEKIGERSFSGLIREGCNIQFYSKVVSELKYLLHFENSKLKKCELFYPDGQLLREAYYDENQVLTGEDKYFYPGGKLQRVTNYKDGNLNGETIFFDPFGNIDCSLEFSQGKVVKSTFEKEAFRVLKDL